MARMGRPPDSRRDHIRNCHLSTQFREAEFADIDEIAKGWDVPRSIVVWCLVHEQLATIRRCAVNYGRYGKKLAALDIVLRSREPRPSDDDGPTESETPFQRGYTKGYRDGLRSARTEPRAAESPL